MKAKIITVGTVEDGQPTGWAFDGRGTDVAGIEVKSDGSELHAGYTVEELAAIAAESTVSDRGDQK